ncbi:hypothetical protein X777_06383 [Ooceraea biroi]|uniref:Uncharacterized protein n=1 Tax=Ooceraea biroi TaxID=2015173 RepID=A0A026WE47_OOCBI|nr:hypothetical protein X777_06383 [Ooceraea biroi]
MYLSNKLLLFQARRRSLRGYHFYVPETSKDYDDTSETIPTFQVAGRAGLRVDRESYGGLTWNIKHRIVKRLPASPLRLIEVLWKKYHETYKNLRAASYHPSSSGHKDKVFRVNEFLSRAVSGKMLGKFLRINHNSS